MNTPKKSTTLNRGLRMGRLSAGLFGSYLGYQFQNLFLDGDKKEARRQTFQNNAARKVREELQSLKGPVMKLGQILSMQSHLLPKDVTAELANLQMRAPAMHPSLARAQFKASFGKFPEEVFRSFEPEPFAAASLGQVHRATAKDGAKLAVKVQYPAIRSAIENDFKLVRSAAIPARLSGHVTESVFKEIEQGMLQETDYCNEADNIDFFREKLQSLPYVHVPAVHRKLSTDRILTMSHLPGQPLGDFLAHAKPTQAQRDRIGFRLLNLFSFQTHGLNAIHADPHPGNYLIQSGDEIGLVDFGCVKKFSPDFIQTMSLFRKRVWLEGEESSRRLARYIWGPEVLKNPRMMHRVLRDAIEFYNIIFPTPSYVDFGDPHILQRLTAIWETCVKHKMINPEWAFYSRAELGLYNLLHQLRSRIDTSQIFAAPPPVTSRPNL